MQVTIQMTGYCAQLCYNRVFTTTNHFWLVLYVAIQFGLYLHKKSRFIINFLDLCRAFSLWGFFSFQEKSFLLIIRDLKFSLPISRRVFKYSRMSQHMTRFSPFRCLFYHLDLPVCPGALQFSMHRKAALPTLRDSQLVPPFDGSSLPWKGV